MYDIGIPDNDADMQPLAIGDLPEEPDEALVKRSTRVRQPSTRYSPNEFVLLTDGGELEY